MFVAVNVDVGAGSTVIVTLVSGEVHVGLPAFATINVNVFTPGVAQLKV